MDSVLMVSAVRPVMRVNVGCSSCTCCCMTVTVLVFCSALLPAASWQLYVMVYVPALFVLNPVPLFTMEFEMSPSISSLHVMPVSVYVSPAFIVTDTGVTVMIGIVVSGAASLSDTDTVAVFDVPMV